jgi:hypothetical protein
MLKYFKNRSNNITMTSTSTSNGDNGNIYTTNAISPTSWLSQAFPNVPAPGRLLSHLTLSLHTVFRHRSTTTVSLIVALLVFSTWISIPFAGPGVTEHTHADYQQHSDRGAAQSSQTSTKNGKTWTIKWMHQYHNYNYKTKPAASRILQENYTEKDGLLYFSAAAPPNATSGVGAAYASMYPQRHPILYLIEKGM